MNIQKEIIRLVKRYGTSNPFELADYLSIIVIREPLGQIYGYHNYVYRQHFIHINSALDDIHARFTAAHELGHVILHPAINTSFLTRFTFINGARIERQANTFAVTLLCYGIEPVDGFTVRETAAVYGIPREYADMLQKCLFA